MSAPKGNKFALGNTGGRPPKYETVEELEAKIQEYFDSCQPEQFGDTVILNNPTVTGLALFLGFAQRKSLLDYKEREEFCNTIKRAISCVENAYEQRLSANNPTGAIFALKNLGWVDKQEIDQTNRGGVDIRVVYEDDNKTETPPSGTETGTE